MLTCFLLLQCDRKAVANIWISTHSETAEYIVVFKDTMKSYADRKQNQKRENPTAVQATFKELVQCKVAQDTVDVEKNVRYIFIL